jgi:hypothetical protein
MITIRLKAKARAVIVMVTSELNTRCFEPSSSGKSRVAALGSIRNLYLAAATHTHSIDNNTLANRDGRVRH